MFEHTIISGLGPNTILGFGTHCHLESPHIPVNGTVSGCSPSETNAVITVPFHTMGFFRTKMDFSWSRRFPRCLSIEGPASSRRLESHWIPWGMHTRSRVSQSASTKSPGDLLGGSEWMLEGKTIVGRIETLTNLSDQAPAVISLSSHLTLASSLGGVH